MKTEDAAAAFTAGDLSKVLDFVATFFCKLMDRVPGI